MIGQSLFSIYYPAHAAALQGTRGLLVEGIDSSLHNLNQADFQDTQPASALSSVWGRLSEPVVLPVQRLFRPDLSAASTTVGDVFVDRNFRCASGGKDKGLGFSGKEEETEAPVAAPVAAEVGDIDIPKLPGIRPGSNTFDALVHALAEAGLAENPDASEPQLLGPVWLKAPGTTSGFFESLDALRHAYYQLFVQGTASQATVEKYVPGAVVVEVHLDMGPDGEFQVLSLQLKKRTKVSTETQALSISDLPEGKNQILFQAAKRIAREAGVTGAAKVKFLFDPSSKDVFFLKLK